MKKYIVRAFSGDVYDEDRTDAVLLWRKEVEAESDEGAYHVATGELDDFSFVDVERAAMSPRLIIKLCRWIVENI